jgi:4-hydroxy-3-polyprenylbenzoate decarboxylase
MSLALGVADLEEHAQAIGELVHTRAPKSARELAEMAGKLPALASTVPRSVSKAASQEVVLRGDDVDLFALPVMTTWPKDGGPFFTLPNVITKDPDTGLRNIGMYRMQRIDRNTTAMHWQIHKTGARHFRRAKEKGQRLEVAVAFGGDPALTYAATAPLPDGIDEWMFAGFLRKKPVEHVKCKTVDLEVPADADFVLEGYVDPAEEMFAEGPFGDHTGYYTPVDAFPRFHVTCVTHRNDAVYPATLVGPPPMEDAWLGKATERLFLPLLRMMLPEVVDMNLPVEGAFHNLAIVSIDKQYPFHAARVAHALWGMGQMSFTKVIVVVDEDVDVQNVGEVAWRLLANLDPKRDVSMVDGPVDQLDHGASQALWGGKMAIDGTKKWPEEGYKREWPEICKHDPAVVKRVEHAIANREMFDRIAPSYDVMNKLMTGGIDRRWRAKVVEMLRDVDGPILDLCAGTLDFSAMIERAKPGANIVACDVSRGMLDAGRSKVKRVETVVGDALDLPFADKSFGAVVCGFGVRNLADLDRGIDEVKRVLRPGGVFITLELFKTPAPIGSILRFALPKVGRLVAKDEGAYAYLASSMSKFLSREDYERRLAERGLEPLGHVDLLMGVASIVRAQVGLPLGLRRGPPSAGLASRASPAAESDLVARGASGARASREGALARGYTDGLGLPDLERVP